LFAEYGAQTLDIARHDGKGDVTLETVNLPSASEKTLIFSAKTPLFTKKLRAASARPSAILVSLGPATRASV
jgi:hypothetical protein